MRFFTVVPESVVFIIQRFGVFNRVLNPGFHFLSPFIDQIAYKHNLKEQAFKVQKQQAVTQDNVTVNVGGAIFYRIIDPYKVSYNIDDPANNVANLTQTTTRSEIGKLKLDELFQERNKINQVVREKVDKVSQSWGIKTIRYEILSIDPPTEIRKSMTYEAEAERLRRRDIKLSQAKKIAKINLSQGRSQMRINRAQGTAERIKLINQSRSESLVMISDAIQKAHGKEAVKYILTTNYLKGLMDIIQQANVAIIPNSKGKDNGQSDMLSMAAMMQMKSSTGTSTTKGKKGKSNSNNNSSDNSSDPELNISDKQVQDFLKKYNYYSDPVLYDDDDIHDKPSF